MINIEIKIDTKKDTHEDIQKMIDFLQNFISKTESAPNQPLSEGAFNLFSENNISDLKETELANNEKKDEDDSFDITQLIEPY